MSINFPSSLRKHLTLVCSSVTCAVSQTNNEIATFDSKSHCWRTDLHDARDMSSTLKNIY